MTLLQPASHAWPWLLPTLLLAAGCVAAAAQESRSVTPPPGATVLFDGSDLSNWVHRNGRQPAGWQVRDGYLEVVPRSGDIRTREEFTDFHLSVEFWLPHMPEARGQARANSGVYLQGRYEIQVLDSYGIENPQSGDCGGIYNVAPPRVNAARPPEQWQTYEIIFRAPRVRDGEIAEHARVTVIWNGVVIHNNREIPNFTGGNIGGDPGSPGPILLQDHGDLVRFRNIWIAPLD